MKPVVTIGLCVKNNENTIKEALHGITEQVFSHELIEVIVVDGNSQDDTMRLIREIFSTSDIKTKFFSENEGLGFARQLVVNNATGKYIIWVDGDIIISDNYLTLQVKFMESHNDVGIAAGSFGLNPDDNWVSLIQNIGYVIDSERNNGKQTSRLIGTEGSIMRTKAIRMAGGFDPKIKGAHEDTFLSYKIRSKGWKFFITKAKFYERQRVTWKDLWKQHVWYGYGLHFVQHKNKGRNLFRNKTNDRIFLSSLAYKLTHRKVVFLMPLNFVFKYTALVFGLMKAHFEGYGHDY